MTPPKSKPDDEGIVITSATIKVGMKPVRAALSAVVPHCEPTKTGSEPDVTSRVRLVVGKTELHVLATSQATAAVAAVAIDEDDRKLKFAVTDGPLVVDLRPGDVRAITQMFRAARADAAASDQWAELYIDTIAGGPDGTGELGIRDVSALFPGRKFGVPTIPVDPSYPDVMGAVGKALANAGGAGKQLVTKYAGAMALFAPAQVQYGEPLLFEAIGTGDQRGWLVQCGPAFLGTLSSRHHDDDSLKRRDSHRRAHLARFGLGADLKAV